MANEHRAEGRPAAPVAGSATARGLLAWRARLAAAPLGMRWFLALGLLALVASLDTATGRELSFSIFYLLPVVFAGSLVSRAAGQLTAVLGAAVWGILEVAAGSAYSAPWIPVWNSGVRLGFFLLVNELVVALEHAYARERQLARTDTLTGIANARVFAERIELALAASRRSGRPFSLAYVDLDRFKQVNDRLGHSEGDRLLRAVASRLAAGARATDTIARLGGDEFGLLMPDASESQARALLERVADDLAGEIESRWPIGATVGAVTFRRPPAGADEAVRQADALMYEAKAAGRGRVLQATWPEPEGGDRLPASGAPASREDGAARDGE